MNAFSFLLIFTTVFSCIEQNKNGMLLSRGLLYQDSQSTKIITYKFENLSYKQIVEVKNLCDTEISFKIITQDKKEKKSLIIQGLARRKITETLEQDTDEKGEQYDAYQYEYSNGECLLLIRIGKYENDLMKLFSFRCDNLLGEKDGLFTLSTLLRKIGLN
jgi:hypothetical protein